MVIISQQNFHILLQSIKENVIYLSSQRYKSFILNERGRGRRENRRSTGDSKQQGARPKKPIIEQPPKKLQTAFYNSHSDGKTIFIHPKVI